MNESIETSVIMPAFNAEGYVASAIESVLAQTRENLELLVIDDKSTDSTRDIVRSYVARDDRVVLLELSENRGAAVARNRGLDIARARYIAFLDADDLWHPDKLDRQLTLMDKHQWGFSCTSYSVIGPTGKLLGKTVRMARCLDLKGYLNHNLIQTVGVVVDRSMVQYDLLYAPDLRRRQDAATWIQVLRGGTKCYGVSEVLAFYRRTPGSLSKNRIKAVMGTWRLYRDIAELPLPFAMVCFLRYAVLAVWKRLYVEVSKKGVVQLPE
jgi:teichuronic acid biosynthesis glycosyltransferase TuaG